MNNNIELQDEISVDEYKAWLTGLLRGKGNQLPDLNDWKAIKKMTDKIVEVQNPYITPAPYVAPLGNWWENQPTCGSTGDITNMNDIVLSHGIASAICIEDNGDVEINTVNSISIGSISGEDYDCCDGLHASSYPPPSAPKSPQDHTFDTSNYMIVTACGEDLSNIAKLWGVKE